MVEKTDFDNDKPDLGICLPGLSLSCFSISDRGRAGYSGTTEKGDMGDSRAGTFSDMDFSFGSVYMADSQAFCES